MFPGEAACLIVAGCAIAAALISALFSRIAAAQESAIGCFVAGAIFFCLLATLLLCLALIPSLIVSP
jgi:hypothetical protein